jgi:L-ascorbate metabolism protein UlaG (beta-lactamase superfamily)
MPSSGNSLNIMMSLQRRAAIAVLLAIMTATAAMTRVGNAQRPPQPAPPARDSLVITFLANEGVMLSSGGTTILIDALFGDGLRGYGIVTQPTRTAIERAQPPFDRVNAVLTTHTHSDHFEARPVFEHLQHNPGATFISSTEAVRKVRAVDSSAASAMGRRLVGIDPPRARRVRVATAGTATIYALGLPHGDDANLPVNVGWVVDIGGRRVMHVGDGDLRPDEFASLALGELGIDVALLSPHYLTTPGLADAVRRHIRPTAIVAIHGPPLGRAPGLLDRMRDEWTGVVRDVGKAFPDARFFTRQMETFVIK